MLILSREIFEEIHIGEGENKVVIKLMEIKPSYVKLGIVAPREVPIIRCDQFGQNQTKRKY